MLNIQFFWVSFFFSLVNIHFSSIVSTKVLTAPPILAASHSALFDEVTMCSSNPIAFSTNVDDFSDVWISSSKEIMTPEETTKGVIISWHVERLWRVASVSSWN